MGSSKDMRVFGLAPREWDRIIKSLEFAADHSRDHCTRENNIRLAAELKRRLRTDAVKKENSVKSSRRHRERGIEDGHDGSASHDPDANNLEFMIRHPMEIR